MFERHAITFFSPLNLYFLIFFFSPRAYDTSPSARVYVCLYMYQFKMVRPRSSPLSPSAWWFLYYITGKWWCTTMKPVIGFGTPIGYHGFRYASNQRGIPPVSFSIVQLDKRRYHRIKRNETRNEGRKKGLRQVEVHPESIKTSYVT